MANKSITLNERLYEYLLKHSMREPPVLQRLRLATENEKYSGMRSAPEQDQFLAMLLKLMGAQRVLEVGTYTGYATLWMALALPDNGEIVACDISEHWTSIGQKFWKEAGVSNKIHLELRPALETLDDLLSRGEQNSFDFAFIDADKINYSNYFEQCLKLVRAGGIIAIDNVLWGGDVADIDKIDEDTEAIRELNTNLACDERIELCMLPIADGMSLVLKR